MRFILISFSCRLVSDHACTVSCVAAPLDGFCHVSARLKWHRVCKVEMTPGHRGGLTRPHLSPEFCAMDAPLSAYLAPPDCLAAAGVVDRPADGSADMKLAARARMPAPR
jgi:hypothetical protein